MTTSTERWSWIYDAAGRAYAFQQGQVAVRWFRSKSPTNTVTLDAVAFKAIRQQARQLVLVDRADENRQYWFDLDDDGWWSDGLLGLTPTVNVSLECGRREA